MKHSTGIFLSLAAILLTSCVSVPRDAGTNDVQQAITERGGAAVEWNRQPSTADHARVEVMLQDELTSRRESAARSVTSYGSAGPRARRR